MSDCRKQYYPPAVQRGVDDDMNDASTEEVRRMAGELIELVGRNVYHRRNFHNSLHIRNCETCTTGRAAETRMVCDMEKALDQINKDALG